MDTGTLSHDILSNLPQWIIAALALMWAGKNFLLPFFARYTDAGKTIMKNRADKIELELAEVKVELAEWKRRFLQLDLEYKSLSNKYSSLLGVVKGFQVYLREKGVSDFPVVEADEE